MTKQSKWLIVERDCLGKNMPEIMLQRYLTENLESLTMNSNDIKHSIADDVTMARQLWRDHVNNDI